MTAVRVQATDVTRPRAVPEAAQEFQRRGLSGHRQPEYACPHTTGKGSHRARIFPGRAGYLVPRADLGDRFGRRSDIPLYHVVVAGVQ